MARKGNQQKNGADRQASNLKKRNSDLGCAEQDVKGHRELSETKVFPAEELPSGNHPSSPQTKSTAKTNHSGDEHKSKQKPKKQPKKDKKESNDIGTESHNSFGSHSGDCNGNSTVEDPTAMEENGPLPHFEKGRKRNRNNRHSRVSILLNKLNIQNALERLEASDNAVVRKLKPLALAIFKVASEWMENQRPLFTAIMTKIENGRVYAKTKIELVYPVVLKWLVNVGSIMFLIGMLWLDCAVRGIDSFLRMGTTSFFSVIWCSIFSMVAMVGIFKLLVVLTVAAIVGFFIGFTLGIIVLVLSGAVFLWIYGSFWTTMLFIFLGGLSFALSHERVALLITTVYSVYCAWAYVGWLGLVVGFNVAFVSSDILIYFLKNSVNRQSRPNEYAEQTPGMQGQPGFFNSEHVHASSSSETGPGFSADRSPGVPSTSGADSELTSEDEIVRLLNCTDHYSAMGLTRYENVDVSLLKREYKKKAMLVHPDKNMGNEKAVEAFKKLQNAYEVLLDSAKQKVYDDELRKEELLNIFRRFQSTSQMNGGHGFFASGMARSETDGGDPLGESRRIACKKCNNFHLWLLTRKSKSQARWCQDCKEFHPAKDGDGWVEQSSQPFLFGLLQKVDTPVAFVCADSKIYDASEWYICQGMRCPANTHKPSFHVNTSIASKHNSGKSLNAGQKGGGRMPNMEDCMTEEEFFEWFQNAVQAGVFDNMNGGGPYDESPSSKPGNNSSKSGGGSSTSTNTSTKRKKKGKKQW